MGKLCFPVEVVTGAVVVAGAAVVSGALVVTGAAVVSGAAVVTGTTVVAGVSVVAGAAVVSDVSVVAGTSVVDGTSMVVAAVVFSSVTTGAGVLAHATSVSAASARARILTVCFISFLPFCIFFVSLRRNLFPNTTGSFKLILTLPIARLIKSGRGDNSVTVRVSR